MIFRYLLISMPRIIYIVAVPMKLGKINRQRENNLSLLSIHLQKIFIQGGKARAIPQKGGGRKVQDEKCINTQDKWQGRAQAQGGWCVDGKVGVEEDQGMDDVARKAKGEWHSTSVGRQEEIITANL